MTDSEGSRTWLALLGLAGGLLVVGAVGQLLGGGADVYVPLVAGLAAAAVGAYLGRRVGRDRTE